MNSSSLTDISFGRFVLQRNERRLLANNKPLLLGARAFDVLTVLLENAGQLVTKQRLFDQVWSGTVVEENNLQVHVSTLRRLLGADAIATVAGRGYRLTAPLTSLPTSDPTPYPPPAPALQRLPRRRRKARQTTCPIAEQWPCCRLSTWGATQSRSISRTAWPRTSLPT